MQEVLTQQVESEAVAQLAERPVPVVGEVVLASMVRLQHERAGVAVLALPSLAEAKMEMAAEQPERLAALLAFWVQQVASARLV